MKTTIVLIILAVLVWGGYSIFSKENTVQVPTETVTNSETSIPVTVPAPSVKEFTVVGKPFSFTPETIEVNKGDTVRIVFQNQNGTHDWVIDEFNTRTKILQSGQSETVEFVADKTGSFEYYCSIGTHRQMGMKGTLIVK